MMRFQRWDSGRTDAAREWGPIQLLIVLAVVASLILLSLFLNAAKVEAQGSPRDVLFGARFANGVPASGITYALDIFDYDKTERVGQCTTDEAGTCSMTVYGGFQYLVTISGYSDELDMEIASEEAQAQTLGHGEARGVGLFIDNGTVPLKAYYVLVPREDGYLYPTWDQTNHRAFPEAMTPEPSLPEESEFERDEGVVTQELEAAGGATPTLPPPVATVELPTPQPSEPPVDQLVTTDEVAPAAMPETTPTPSVAPAPSQEPPAPPPERPLWSMVLLVLFVVGAALSTLWWIRTDYLPSRRTRSGTT